MSSFILLCKSKSIRIYSKNLSKSSRRWKIWPPVSWKLLWYKRFHAKVWRVFTSFKPRCLHQQRETTSSQTSFVIGTDRSCPLSECSDLAMSYKISALNLISGHVLVVGHLDKTVVHGTSTSHRRRQLWRKSRREETRKKPLHKYGTWTWSLPVVELPPEKKYKLSRISDLLFLKKFSLHPDRWNIRQNLDISRARKFLPAN